MSAAAAPYPSAPPSSTPSSHSNGPAPTDGGNGGERPFAHIQDLQAQSLTGYQPGQSINQLLQIAEHSLGQAQSLLDFRRPDFAYIEYLRASEIVVNIIPRHKDRVDFLHDQYGDKKYGLLQKKIRGWDDQFVNIKNIIVNNNKRSGVRPKGYETHPSGHERSASQARLEEAMRAPMPQSNANHRQTLNGVEKIKPSVSPKPDRLHGRAISTASALSNGGPGEALADRFAKLRLAGGGAVDTSHSRPSSRASPASAQDSPITMPNASDYGPNRNSTDTLARTTSRPNGPRMMASSTQHSSNLVLDTSVPASMPKAPSPTYSPARNMNLQGHVTAPRHSARSLAGAERRSTSMMSSSASSIAPNGSAQSDGYFPRNSTMTPNAGVPERGSVPRRKSVHVPKETQITADRLYDYLERYNILLIDVRSREEFDQGHIYTRNIICIEPMGLRAGMSADEVLESLVLSPEQEQDLFEDRDQFDLVVYYDTHTQSDSYLLRPRDDRESKLKYLHEALYDYNHQKPLQRPPILLIGGIDAWADLVGNQALATSQTLARVKAGRPTPRRPSAQTNGSSRLSIPKRRLRDYNPLDAEEEAKWFERARAESVTVPQTQSLAEEPEGYDEELDEHQHDAERSDEDPGSAIREFLERFPEAGTLEQNRRLELAKMPSRSPPGPPDVPAKVPHYPPPRPSAYMQPPAAYPQPPQVPARPAPAAPRMSYTGVSERSISSQQLTGRSASGLAPYIPAKYMATNMRLPRTGLVNFGVTCYMNSTLQALSATTPLSIFFLDDQFRNATQRENWKGSKGVLPELYSNVIRSLWKGDVESIKPTTFRNFCGRLNREWSIDRQQDAKEFFDFLIDCLHEDLNSMWSRTPLRALTEAEEIQRERMPKTVVAKTEWSRYTHREQSFLTQLFGGQHASRLRCTTCGFTSTTYEAFYSISVEIPRNGRPATLEDCLRSYCAEEMLAGDEVWKCPHCKKEREATKQITITRVPQFLVIHFKRFSAGHQQRAQKVRAPIHFPLHGLNLSPFVLPTPSSDELAAIAQQYGPEHGRTDPSMTPPYVYDAYSVIRHIGGTLASGHYTCAVKDRARRTWRLFNDTRVVDFDPERLGKGNELQNEEAYIVFYQRLQREEVEGRTR